MCELEVDRMTCSFPHLFSTFQLKGVRLKNRLVKAPMECNYARCDGTVSERNLEYYRRVAAGGVGLVIVEASFVHPGGRGRRGQIGIHDRTMLPGLSDLARVIHSAGAAALIQIHHAGANTSSSITGKAIVGPSDIALSQGAEVPEPLSRAGMEEIKEAYVAAAVRAREADFDGVEIHGAHGYLLTQFLSPLHNVRRDEYGGSLENRVRYAVEIVTAVRQATGGDYLFGYRISVSDLLPGGLMLSDGIRAVQCLEQAGLDFIDVSAGTVGGDRRALEARHGLVEMAAVVKQQVHIPVIGVGGIREPASAEHYLARGDVDLIAMARALHADPELPRKAMTGRIGEINRCRECNRPKCGLLGKQLPISCNIYPWLERLPGCGE